MYYKIEKQGSGKDFIWKKRIQLFRNKNENPPLYQFIWRITILPFYLFFPGEKLSILEKFLYVETYLYSASEGKW